MRFPSPLEEMDELAIVGGYRDQEELLHSRPQTLRLSTSLAIGILNSTPAPVTFRETAVS